MRLPLSLHKWKFWQWQPKSNFEMQCFFWKSPTIILLCNFFWLHIAIGLWSRLTKIIGKFFDYNEFCTYKGILRKNFGKYNKFRHIKIKSQKEKFGSLPKLCQWGLLFRFSRFRTTFIVFGAFFRGFSVSNRVLHPPKLPAGSGLHFWQFLTENDDNIFRMKWHSEEKERTGEVHRIYTYKKTQLSPFFFFGFPFRIIIVNKTIPAQILLVPWVTKKSKLKFLQGVNESKIV